MKTNGSTIGDWLFLIGGAGTIGGYLLYENQERTAQWLAWFQSLGATPIAPNGGILAWLIANWGLLLLLAAIIFAVYKLWADSAPIVEDGALAPRKPVRFVHVKLVR